MPEPVSTKYSPRWQLSICLVMIIVVRVYYAWVESNVALIQWFDRGVGRVILLHLFAILVSYGGARLAKRYFNPIMAVPFSAVAGGAATLIYSSITGTLLGTAVGLVCYSHTLSSFLWKIMRLSLRVGILSLAIGLVLTMFMTSIYTHELLWQALVLLLVSTMVSMLVILCYRHHCKSVVRLLGVSCFGLIWLAAGLLIGPTATTLLRVRALERVGYVAWNRNHVLAFSPLGRADVVNVTLSEEATDRELALVAEFDNLVWLRLDGSNVSSQGCERTFRRLKRLELLEVEGVPLDDAAIRALGTSKRLFIVQLTGTAITDEAFVHLSRIPTLRHLRVDGVRRDGRGLRSLGKSGRLRELLITDMPLVDEDLRDLQGLQGLINLKLHRTLITGSGFRHLSQLPRLGSLSIAESPVEARYFRDLPATLIWLELAGIPITDEGSRAIAAMRSLVGVSLLRADITNREIALLKNHPATRVHLDGTHLTHEGTDLLSFEDILICVDDADLTADDIGRFAKMGHDTCLTNCRLDDSAIKRLVELANEGSSQRFEIRSTELSEETHKLLSGTVVRVRTQWPMR